ncbi:HAD-IIIC family phosphatase [Pasteurella multocida]|uniref:EcbF n=1 Tax=Pasteurella multocida TaxID=747 RepID=Q9AHM1_PASMD|nr:HAD-IIIC family phosphatase [Pasteurella multocida]AAK17915.1 EcbF [Pasteurella multocida]MCL7798878.1 HAD-IIIC family phosphatase [Pasteurella multocida]MCL7805065.1 HAD-IIIC family phosphatase [Pasteurella multocida]MCL7808323.1 HAD-IIIC family phosphatase [Pasteurella multocida]MCL7809790.1 HAD-IIIC family phosphatase [Pasteurella multocida]
MKRIIMDLDNTITITENGDYINSKPIKNVIEKLQQYKKLGFEIVISSSRNMRTYEGNIGKINIHTLPNIINWLNQHNVPHDEIYIGKPWCGEDGFYVDDRAIRPEEFVNLTYEQIKNITKIDKDEE